MTMCDALGDQPTKSMLIGDDQEYLALHNSLASLGMNIENLSS